MMFTLMMETSNTAFEGDTAAEIARILQQTANELLQYNLTYQLDKQTLTLRDVNGNTVGKANWHFDEE